jgi:hypothetical protein
MERAIFRVQLVTPCFLGGAGKQAEWRAASLRGQLRWWYRAVAGAVYAGDLARVREDEERIFGSTGRSAALRVRALSPPAALEGNAQSFGDPRSEKQLAEIWGEPKAAARLRLQGGYPSRPLHYLGYGPIAGGKVERSYLPAKAETCFELQWGRPVGKECRQLFDRALWAWLNLGALGARNRKGFGSLRLLGIEGNWTTSFPPPPQTRDALIQQIREIPPWKGSDLPRWTCFSSHSRIYLGTDDHDFGMDAMEKIGAWLIGFRRRYGSPNDEREALRNRDYTWASPKGTDPRGGFPDRVGFGLPLPFRRKLGKTDFEGEMLLWDSPDGDPRRASPLLLHVARLGNTFIPMMTYLPAVFLPKEGEVYFEDEPSKSSPPTLEQLAIVQSFLDDLVSKNLIQQVAP